MIVIIKIKVINPFRYSRALDEVEVKNASLIWAYKTFEDASKGKENFLNRLSKGPIELSGYKKMRNGKEADQYAIDLSYNGKKDTIYLAIEKEISPLVRDWQLNELLEK